MTLVHSFDVFDTLLTRAVGSPRSVFLLLGRLPDVARVTRCAPEEFARLRVAAEARARRGRDEVTLDQIYAEIGVGLCLDAATTRRLAALEVALERRLSRPVPSARGMLKGASDASRVAVSDMYLPGIVVRGLLDDHGLGELLDDVLVSSEEGVTKGTGRLYERMLALTGARPEACVHVGDHRLGDQRVPRLLGIRVRPFSATALNRYEHTWESHAEATGGLSSLVAGASRLARLTVEGEAWERPIVDVAAGVAAPILVAYVLWVLRSAKAEGVRRLYFLARDGEILYLIARRLSEKLGLEIDLRYLYGSRSVYHRASLATKPVSAATWAWRAMYKVRAVDVLQRLGLNDEQSRAELERLDIAQSAVATDHVVATIVGDAQVVAQVKRSARQLQGRIHDYLRQEGLCDGTPYAIVDTGWAGRIAQAFEEALPPDATPLRRGYFFGYMKRADGYDRPDVLRGYLFDEVAETGYAGDFEQAYGPLETFAAANHGMTTDFRRDRGRLEPVLAGETNPALDGWPWQLYRTTVMQFVEELLLDDEIANVDADLRAAVAAVLDEFWSRPTRPEARAWGSFVYEDDVLAKSRNRLAVGWTVGEFARKMTRRSYEGRQLWLTGAVTLTSALLRPAARFGLWVNDCRAHGGVRAVVPPRWQHRAALAKRAWQVRRRAGTVHTSQSNGR